VLSNVAVDPYLKPITSEILPSSNTVIGGYVLVPFDFMQKRFLPAPLICTDNTNYLEGNIGANEGYSLFIF
jgi:hypothetical protein